MAKVTIGIPAYRTTFLMEAIASALSQSFTDYELLISDDSRDGSVSELVERIRDPRVRLIQGPRRGLVQNSVAIWEAASAPLLKYLYDDDRLYPTAVADLVELLEKDNRHVFAFSRRDVIDQYGRVIRQPEVFAGDHWTWFERHALADHAIANMVNPVGEPTAMLIRRSAFPDASCLHSFGGLPIRHLVDIAFVMNASGQGRAVASPKRLCAFRQHSAQVSSDRGAPEFAAGLFEWEIFLRAGVQSGQISPQTALRGLPHLDALYRRLGRGFEEVTRFVGDLRTLGDLLGAGDTQVVTETFRQNLAFAEQLSAERAAGSASTHPSGEVEAAPARRVRIHLDAISRRGARGWAWLPEAPEKALRVEAVSEHKVVGSALADQERPDLREVGSGRYGFEMTFQELITADELPTLRAIIDEEDFEPGDARFPPLEGGPPPTGVTDAAILREHAKFTTAGPAFEEFQPSPPIPQDAQSPLVAAFYLSQFHAIPENDEFWGKGFTEWRQLARGAPRFPGHYQPRIPRDLGFYNLLDLEVMRRQAQMARASGVGAFGFYYYWFNRKRVLHRPIEQFLASDIEMPFFLIWANENWTRTWDGGEQAVLLEQQYRDQDEDALVDDLARHMLDPRHVRLNGRPLFVIYNAMAVPDTARSIDRWRRKWVDRFHLEPLIFMAQTFHREDPRPDGLDGALEFPPHKIARYAGRREVSNAFSRDFAGHVMPYNEFMRASLTEAAPGFPLIKTVVPNWDNDARRPNRGMLVEGSTPEKYQFWLERLIERAIDAPVFGRPVVAVNAWNEWAEGAYLEPDVYYGAAYLNATGRALRNAMVKKGLLTAAGATSEAAG